MKRFLSRSLVTLAVCGGALCAPSPAAAQPMAPAGGPPSAGGDGPRGLAPDVVLQTVGVDQKLDAQISPDLTFTNEAGQTVRLGDYFGKRPLLLSLMYYECPGLCTASLNGIARSLKPLTFTPGVEFDVLTVSFDPREKPELAASKKKRYLKEYNRPGAEAGWHFLTGDEANIKALTETVGFRYRYDENTKQYAHAAALMVVTPNGRLSRYFYGFDYSSKDIRLGLVEAADEKIGTMSDAVNLFCYKYDPASGRYSLAVMRLVRGAGVATVVAIGTFMFVMVRRERHGRLRAAGPGPDDDNDAPPDGAGGSRPAT